MALKIDQNIVGYAIRKDEDDEATVEVPTEAPPEHMHEDVERPEELRGYTYKIKTPLSDHALYITINDMILNVGTRHEQHLPFEIFVNSKNMEHFQWVLALTRVISAVFRKGGDITFLADELQQVFDPQGGYFKKGGKFMPSLVAEIGEVIETHMKRIGLIEDDQLGDAHQALLDEKRAEFAARNAPPPDTLAPEGHSLEPVDDNDAASDFPKGAQQCKKCHQSSVVRMDGCMTCLSCGDSKCG